MPAADIAAPSPVFGILKNPSMIDYPGRLAAVLFLGGCNFRCRFCHNSELINPETPPLPWSELDSALRKFAADWVTSAVITGGEPCLSPDLPELILKLKSRLRWAIKLDTNGSMPLMLQHCLPQLDYVAMDIKASPEMYPELTGCSNIAPLNDSIKLLMTSGKPHEFRTTVIDGFHSDAQMHAIGRWLQGAARLVLQPFIPRPSVPDSVLAATPRTSLARLKEIAAFMKPYVQEIIVRGET